MNKIKKGDKVKVMRGKDAGKEGEVLRLVSGKDRKDKAYDRVVVKGVNVSKRHQKPVPALNLAGGIIEAERPIDVSNVMLVDPKSGKPTRVGFKFDEKTGKKFRISKDSGTQLS